jgi:D-alanine transaminase
VSDIVFLNGEYLDKHDAKVSVLDRGFLFGDGVYEVIPVYHKKPFRLYDHLNRLKHSAELINISLPLNDAKFLEHIETVISRYHAPHLSIYIQITRGVSHYRDHLAETLTPTILIMPNVLNVESSELTAIKTVLLDDIRWQHCNIKSISLLGNILLKQEALSLGADEALLHRSQILTEGATSNIFIVKNNEIHTPIKSDFILSGITRDVIIELAHNYQINLLEKDITVSELYDADEVWVSSSSREISPVTQINDKIVGQGGIGAISKVMHSAFQQFKQSLLDSPR